MRNTRVEITKNTRQKRGILRYIKASFDRQKLGELLVIKGLISSQDLRNALRTQKTSHKPLGHILIETGLVTRFQLINLVLGQKALRFTITTFFYFASFSPLAKKSHAADIKDVPARIMLASTDASFGNIHKYPALFGAKEQRSSNLAAFTKWSEMFDRFDASLNTASGQQIAQQLRQQILPLKESSIHETAQNVNRFMNDKKYITDSRNWGKSDYWATPIEFMTRGGDCEDFAIAKYAALRALGVPENRMRVLILQDQKKNIPHAILIVYTEHGAMALDNQIKEMRNVDSIHHYKPIFSINRQAWWLHTTPKSPTATVIASAE